MALATVQQIRDGQGTRLDSLSDTQIQLHLDDAKLIVKGFGIAEDNDYFSQLQRLKTYDTLESTGSIPNEINSESIGDVSVGLDSNIAIGSATFYAAQFERLLIHVRGHYLSVKSTINYDLKERLRQLDKKKVKIGIVGESDSKLLTYAAANEYGANIAITDKMRKFLHWIGIHVKNETTHIIIPERSYIRNTFDNKLYYQELRKKLQNPFEQVLSGERDPETLLDLIGLQYVANVRRTIRDMKEPENHPVTIERKGKGKGILVDSGRLVRSIAYEVVD